MDAAFAILLIAIILFTILIIGAVVGLVIVICKYADSPKSTNKRTSGIFNQFFNNKAQLYYASTYYQITHLSYNEMRYNAGRYGEYRTYSALRHHEAYDARFLFNLYIPKKNGTTELDVVMIAHSGIFVIESKNFNGWIFGNESNKQWTQTLKGRGGTSEKYHFYNPILQNREHIKHLRNILKSNFSEYPIYSIIAFSDRCQFMDVTTNTSTANIMHRCEVPSYVQKVILNCKDKVLSTEDIKKIFEVLYPYSQTTHAEKEAHIATVLNAKNTSSAVVSAPIVISPVVIAEEKTQAVTNDDLINAPRKKTDVGTTAVIANTEADGLSEDTELIQDDKLNTNDEIQTNDTTSNNAGLNTTQQNIEIETSDTIKSESKIRICPRCGKELKIRTARSGLRAGKQFYGCSGYPDCKYVLNIE